MKARQTTPDKRARRMSMLQQAWALTKGLKRKNGRGDFFGSSKVTKCSRRQN